MAKRVSKTGTSAKQTAAVRRTKKDVTPVKKAPVKKVVVKETDTPTATSGNTKTIKPPKNTTKTDTPVVHLAINGNEMPQKNKRPPKTTKGSMFLKIVSNATRDEFNEMGLRVKAGEVQWAYFAIDGDKAYHYYKVLK